MKLKLLITLCVLILISCKNNTEQKNKNNNVEIQDTLSDQTTSNIENNIMKNTEEQNINFTDVFNLIQIIRFKPVDLENTENAEMLEFKKKLKIYEDNDPMINGISSDDLSLLINNNTFFDSQRYVDTEWLNYFLSKYDLYYSYNELMQLSIKQEDLNAIEVLVKHKYLFSAKDLSDAKDSKSEQEFQLQENKKDGYDSYLLKDSKIDDILKLITKKYNSNKIYDKDGYTNLREGKKSSSSIVEKINSGEHIEVLDNPDEEDWFLVQTKDGKKGFVHKSRIISE